MENVLHICWLPLAGLWPVAHTATFNGKQFPFPDRLATCSVPAKLVSMRGQLLVSLVAAAALVVAAAAAVVHGLRHETHLSNCDSGNWFSLIHFSQLIRTQS